MLLKESMSCLLGALSQVVSDMSFRILVPLAGAECRLCEERLDSCVRAAAGIFTDFIFPLCYMSRHANRTPSNTAAAGCFICHSNFFQLKA